MNPSETDFIKMLLKKSKVCLTGDIPSEILCNMESAERILSKIEELIGAETHGDYFRASYKRYLHYLAAGMGLPSGSKVLEIGGAPGHVSIGLHLLGMKVTSINLNEEWRKTYPSNEWIRKLGVIEHDIERSRIPFNDSTFDAVYFTEILEHIAIKNPIEVLLDCNRVMKPGGLFVFSTPNICNISNIYALLNEDNIFWDPNQFYGGTDRHNREYTPGEAYEAVLKSGFQDMQMYGISSLCNWNAKSPAFIASELKDDHPLLRNTTIIIGKSSKEVTACFGSGWHEQESWGVWASAPTSTIEIYAPEQQELNIDLNVMAYQRPSELTILFDDKPVRKLQIKTKEEMENQFTNINMSHRVKSGITYIKLSGAGDLFSPKESDGANDDRRFRLGYSNITVNGLRIL